jgi:hypothetical protein
MKDSNYSALWMIEPFLTGYNGHLFNYAKSISDNLNSNRVGFKIFVSLDCDEKIKKEINTEVVFDKIPNENVFKTFFGKIFKSVYIYNFHLFKGLRKISKTNDLKDKLLFFGTIQHIHIFGLILWLIFTKKKNCPKTVILTLRLSIFRYDLNRWSLSYLWYLIAFKLIKLVKSKCNIFFITDSNKLIDEYKKLTNLHISLLPIPHTFKNTDFVKFDFSKNNNNIVFTSLGSARKNKGFDVIIDSIIHLSKKSNFESYQFILQSNNSSNETIIKSKIEFFNTFNFSNVTLINRELNENEYYSLLNLSDVVLIPYDMGIYYANTSGIFTEAVSFGKPVIVTKNTWMSDNLSIGSGYTFQNRDPIDLALKIEISFKNYKNILNQSKESSEKWNKYHNSVNFVKMLFQLNS